MDTMINSIARRFHEHLQMERFTVFAGARFDFVPGINALVGENGTGKTQLMKALYAYQLACFRGTKPDKQLEGVYQTENLAELISDWDKAASAAVATGAYGGQAWRMDIHRSGSGYELISEGLRPGVSRPVFIPATDMLAHTKAFLATYDEYRIDFDQTYRDIVALLLAPEKRAPTRHEDVLDLLTRSIGGRIAEDNERFYLHLNGSRQAMPLVGEGLRKLATLLLLIQNGWLEPGAVLFWDEPESNVNPALMDEIILALRMLARRGVQVFLATHSYVILKELDLQTETTDSLRYFAFARTNRETQIHAADNYADLMPNRIAEQFDRLYDLELTRATGRRRR